MPEPLRSLLQEQNDHDRHLFSETTEYLELLDVIVEQLELGETDDTLAIAHELQKRIQRTQDITSKAIAKYEDKFPEEEWEPEVDTEG